jgi:uncharacterized protein
MARIFILMPSSFTPKRGLGNGHVMTIYTWGKPRHFPQLPPATERFFDVAPDARVLAHCHWQADRAAHPVLLALHGLESSSSAHYMRGLADKAFAAGFNVLLLNQRNCGGTEALSAGLYHSGLTSDADRVIRELSSIDGARQIVVAGYSLGGNLALKLAGDYGDAPQPEVRAICAVSPVMELELCVRALERRQNFVYQWNFVRGLKARMRRKAACFPDRYPIDRLDRIRSVREFDEVYTAPHFGFRDASDYYHRASAMRVIDRITLPTLIVTADDDPFVPSAPFHDPRVRANPHLNVNVTRGGGHCGFLTDEPHPTRIDDGYWAERQILDFAITHVAGGTEVAKQPEARDIRDEQLVD